MRYIESKTLDLWKKQSTDLPSRLPKCYKCWQLPKPGEGMYKHGKYLCCGKCYDKLLELAEPYMNTLYNIFFHNTLER